MLISCPKCRSIYEIPDDLIGKKGKNFRCQNCSNIWHSMREDALGYEKEVNEEPFVEEIEVKEPPYRKYPANKEKFVVPADEKIKTKIPSSFDIVSKEGSTVYKPVIKTEKSDNEITLTSNKGTSFTISMDRVDTEKFEKKEPAPFFDEVNSLTARKEDSLVPQVFKGFRKTYALLFVLCVIAIGLFLRREIVMFFPNMETHYNKIGLSGLNNQEYLKFENISISETKIDNRDVILIKADIYNDAYYMTFVPDITVSGYKESFKPTRNLLKAYEKLPIEIVIDLPNNNDLVNIVLGFAKS